MGDQPQAWSCSVFLVSTSFPEFWAQALKGQADVLGLCCRPGLLCEGSGGLGEVGDSPLQHRLTDQLQEGLALCGSVAPWGWHSGLFSAVSSARGAGAHPLARGVPVQLGLVWVTSSSPFALTFLFQEVLCENGTRSQVSVLLSEVSSAGPGGVFCHEGDCPWF